MPERQRIVRARTWKDLPEVLEPGVIYDIDGVMIKPHERISREMAKELAAGVKEMVRHL